MRNQRCWANCLDGCSSTISGEHRVSVAAWPSRQYGTTRTEKVAKPVTVRGRPAPDSERLPFERTHPLRQLVVNNLCTTHNSALSDLDSEAGRFTEAIDGFDDLIKERNNPRFRYAPRTWRLDGPVLERWFLKTAISNSDGRALPIGDHATTSDRPSNDLVEMVFGLRPVPPPLGVWSMVAVGDDFSPSVDFEMTFFDSTVQGTAKHVAGCMFLFRRALRFMVNLDSTSPFVPGLKLRNAPGAPREVTMMRPLPTVHHASAELYLRFEGWTPGGTAPPQGTPPTS